MLGANDGGKKKNGDGGRGREEAYGCVVGGGGGMDMEWMTGGAPDNINRACVYGTPPVPEPLSECRWGQYLMRGYTRGYTR